MKRLMIIFVGAVTFGLVFPITDARAQCGPVLRADVPFDFVVNGQEAKAGKYLIEKTNCHTSTPLAVLRDAAGDAIGVVYRSTVEIRSRSAAAAMVFAEHGGKWFLYELRDVDGRYSFQTRGMKAGIRLARASAPRWTSIPAKSK